MSVGDIPVRVRAARDAIDGFDRQIVELLARRAKAVGELAALKRAHQLPIRDEAREQAMHALHARWAAELDLPPNVVDGLFRMVLWASRNLQASLRTEVPPELPPRRILVVGGAGAMGSRFADALEGLGNEVVRADVDDHVDAKRVASEVDVVLFAVPIAVTEEVIADIAPRVSPGTLLMDITSVKEGPVRAMQTAAPHPSVSVIGTHPLFGPAVSSFQGQRVVLTATPDADPDWKAWLETTLLATGLDLVEATPEHHDKIMGVVQVLTHFSTEVLGQTLARLGVPLAETLEFTSPIYYIDMLMAARHFAQPAELYAAIQTGNPNTKSITTTFREVADELAEVVEGRDLDRFGAVFENVRSFFGEFSPRALEESRYLIDRLVERR